LCADVSCLAVHATKAIWGLCHPLERVDVLDAGKHPQGWEMVCGEEAQWNTTTNYPYNVQQFVVNLNR
jgi:hypothetical protein